MKQLNAFLLYMQRRLFYILLLLAASCMKHSGAEIAGPDTVSGEEIGASVLTVVSGPGIVDSLLYDAADINFASAWLASLVKEHGLPPKILVVHRFTQAMVTNYKAIKLYPEVQIVMNMDGFGSPAKKLDSYKVTFKPATIPFFEA